MQANTVQPFVNLTISNIELFSRFVKSPEIADITKVGIEKYFDLMQDLATRVARTNAFVQLNQSLADNYVRFTSEYLQNASGYLSHGQDLMTYQVEEGTRRLRQLTDATSRTIDLGSDAVRRASEQGSETVSRSVDAGARATQRTVDAGANAAEKAADEGARTARTAQQEAAGQAADDLHKVRQQRHGAK